ncbi:hypothetical protein AB0K00_16255 [Dactylosporangium sp. NPDC049525]|uniref:WD40/YVTN/BNR-like repeat-containing protein n=1 Tax=Dactylosporangium sp. NPDC049525 TaxID=3154730 RepID=UPI00341A3767
MRESRVEEEFARFAEHAAGTFRPLPVDALPRRSRRGRLRVWLAGIVVAVLAAGGGVALRPAGPDEPEGFRVTERPVVLAGVTGPHQVRFADRRHGWVFFRNCGGGSPCVPWLGRTTDGGRTWQRVTVPEVRDDDPVSVWYLEALDARHVSLLLAGMQKASWTSADAGDTWIRQDEPTYEEAYADLALRSPDTDRFSVAGDRLVIDGVGDVGTVPVRTGMVVRDVVRLPDGALWAKLDMAQRADETLLVFSADGATWQDVRHASTLARLYPSPARDDVWYRPLTGADTPLELLLPPGRGGAAPTQPRDTDIDGSVVAVGRGRLLVASPRRGLYIWSPTGITLLPVPMGGAPRLKQLTDGSVQLYLPNDLEHPVAVGTADGAWIVYV